MDAAAVGNLPDFTCCTISVDDMKLCVIYKSDPSCTL